MAYQAASLDIARQTLAQIESWQRAGKVGLLDVLQSRQTVISRQNQLLSLKQQRAISRNALALLLNRPPRSIAMKHRRLTSISVSPLPAPRRWPRSPAGPICRRRSRGCARRWRVPMRRG